MSLGFKRLNVFYTCLYNNHIRASKMQSANNQDYSKLFTYR